MTRTVDEQRDVDTPGASGADLLVAGVLLLGGWLVTMVATAFHPSGGEDDHATIFTKYADSGPWVAIHVVQFAGVLVSLAGLLVLFHLLRRSGRDSVLARFAAGTTVATAATWAVLQGLDGVALKQAVDAWQSAPPPEKPTRFANAETVRWLEWGFQSYFRMLLGLSFVLFGVVLLTVRLLAGWVGWSAIVAGLISVVIGLDVGYSGLASGLQDTLGLAFLGVALAFGVGLLLTGVRQRRQQTAP